MELQLHLEVGGGTTQQIGKLGNLPPSTSRAQKITSHLSSCRSTNWKNYRIQICQKLFNLLHSFARLLSPTRSIIKRSLLSLDLSFRTVGEQQRLWRLSDRLTLLSKGEKKSNFKIYLSARHLFVVYSQFDLLKSFHVAVFFCFSWTSAASPSNVSPI